MLRIPKLKLILAAPIAGLAMAAVACGGGGGEADSQPTGVAVVVTSPTGSATPRARRTSTPTVSPSPTPLVVCAPNPDPAAPKALQVEEPKLDARVDIPVHVRGWSSNIGQDGKGIMVSLVDQKQVVLQTNEVPAQPRDFRVPPPGLEITDFTYPFAIDIIVTDVAEPTPYCLWVFQDVDDQGHARGVVQIPVVVLPRS